MSGLRRALLALGLLSLLLAGAVAIVVLGSDHEENRGVVLVIVLTAALAFVGTGLFAWDRRPESNIGPLMTAAGFAWFFVGLQAANNELLFALGALGASLPFAILIHLLLSFPGGRLESTAGRIVVAASYFITTVLQLGWALFAEPAAEGCDNCPANPIQVAERSNVGEVVETIQVVAAMIAIAATIVLVYGRWRRSSAQVRRALTPVVATGGIAFALLGAQLAVDQAGAGDPVRASFFIAAAVVFACLPFAFLLGLLRSRVGRAEEVSTALSAENAQLNAELEATIAELRASRHRIVEAGYAERRRVERDLHDGAQQRLMALTMNLRLAREKLDADPAATGELLDEAMAELAAATAELRELARGIHPVVLSDRGLAAALSGLAERSPVPVEIVAAPSERLPAPVESATYFVVAEALTNVARYAEAEVATVRVEREDGVVEVEISDDGRGGADPEGGTGLRGLEDRVAALDGRLEVRSAAGAGTTVAAVIPCA